MDPFSEEDKERECFGFLVRALGCLYITSDAWVVECECDTAEPRSCIIYVEFTFSRRE